jgi:hypothetical protein
MDSKFYVSLEAARLLKEKGYDGDAEYAYHEIGSFSHWGRNANDIDYLYAAPTKAEAIDWLESKGIVIELSYDDQGHMDNARWQYFIYTNDEDGWVEGMVCSWMEGNYFKTRLEAEEAVIVKALELL